MSVPNALERQHSTTVEVCRFFLAIDRERRVIVARKGDLKPVRHVNIALDQSMSEALLASAERNERRLTQEVRVAIRRYLRIDDVPGEEQVADGDVRADVR
jgi:hypothetical protein